MKIGDFSMELCGGIHVQQTGDLGFLHISSEGAISSGIRRIEAHVVDSGYKHISDLKHSLGDASALLNSSMDQVPASIERIQKENNQLKIKLSYIEKGQLEKLAETILDSSEVVSGIRLVSYLGNDMSVNQLKALWDNLKEKRKKIIGLLATNSSKKSIVICAASADIKDFDCRKVIEDISSKFKGKGGGKRNLAQAGCNEIDNLDSGLEIIKNLL